MLDVSIFFSVTHCTFFINKKEELDFGSLLAPMRNSQSVFLIGFAAVAKVSCKPGLWLVAREKKDSDAEVFLLLYLNPYSLFPIFCCCLTFYYNSDYECSRHQWESYRRGTANFPI